jgi:hypothetical protein
MIDDIFKQAQIDIIKAKYEDESKEFIIEIIEIRINNLVSKFEDLIFQFNHKYKDEKVIALPTEVNGIHPIKIYRVEHHLPSPQIRSSESAMSLDETGKTPRSLKTATKKSENKVEEFVGLNIVPENTS